MEYEKTEQRKKYIEARGKTILTACPGSGKTTSIVYKLGIIRKECRKSYGQYRGIACLSFTKKACYEIISKFKEMYESTIDYPDKVSTIDSFITENIVMPYWNLCEYLKTRPVVVNDKSIIRRLYLVKKDSSEMCICGFNQEHSKLLHKLFPEEINIGLNCFYFKNKKIDPKYKEYAEKVVFYRMAKGFCNSQDIAWIACNILYFHKNIAMAIAKRFPYIIIDEAQDTSEIQCLIIKQLENNGLDNIEFVGDVYQSIYEWRQASPENFEKMINSQNWNVLHLTENRRSVQHIIDVFSRLRKNTDPKITSHNVENKEIPVLVYKYNKSNINSIIDDFKRICQEKKLKNCHVLTRGNNFIRNYKGVTEQVEYWKSNIPYLILKALQCKESGDFSKAIKYLLNVKAELTIKDLNFKEKKDQMKDGYNDVATKAKMVELLYKIPSMDNCFFIWTNKTEKVLKEHFGLEKVCFKPYKRKNMYDMDKLKREPVSKYYREDISSISNCSIETIHSSKGLSYGGVLLLLSSNSLGQNISLNSFNNKTPLTEKQRMIYVACSRAEQFLAFAVPDNISNQKIKDILGVNEEQIKIIGLQLDLF